MAIIEATEATFEELVLKSEKPVVVDFWATWCTPCKMVAPEMEKLASKYEGTVDVVKVDVDANPGISQAFQIMSIPTIAFFRPGQQPKGVVGFQPLERLEQQFGLAEFAPAEAGLTRRAAQAAHSRADTATPRGPPPPGRSLAPEASGAGYCPGSTGSGACSAPHRDMHRLDRYMHG